MANYPNRMTDRLAVTIAAYIERFESWPNEARLSAWALHWIARGLDPEHFAALADRLKIRVTKHSDIAVGGPAGHLVYGEEGEHRPETLERVARELGLDVGSIAHDAPDIVHLELVDTFWADQTFHRFVLGELFRMSHLATELGFWHFANTPVLSPAPFDGLFSFRLEGHAGYVGYVDICSAMPTHERVDQQALAAGGRPRIYLLLCDGDGREDEAATATWLPRLSVQKAVVVTASGLRDDALGDLARAYAMKLAAEAV